jgi:hypothetical protein
VPLGHGPERRKVQLGIENYVIQQTGQAGEKFTIKTIKPYKPRPQRQRRQEQADPEGFDEGTDYQYDANGNKVPF